MVVEEFSRQYKDGWVGELEIPGHSPGDGSLIPDQRQSVKHATKEPARPTDLPSGPPFL